MENDVLQQIFDNKNIVFNELKNINGQLNTDESKVDKSE